MGLSGPDSESNGTPAIERPESAANSKPAVNLKPFELEYWPEEDGDPTENDSDLAMYNLIKGFLIFDGTDARARAGKLVDNIIYFCVNLPSDRTAGTKPYFPFRMILQMSQYIPADHVWQEVLAYTVELLDKESDMVPGPRQVNEIGWQFAIEVTEAYQSWGPHDCVTSAGYYEGIEADCAHWQNLNSFIARVAASGAYGVCSLTWFGLAHAFEEPPVKGLGMDCRLWTACEWLIKCGPLIYEEIRDPRFEVPYAVQRWDLWKKALAQMAAGGEEKKKQLAELEGRLAELEESSEAPEKQTDKSATDGMDHFTKLFASDEGERTRLAWSIDRMGLQLGPHIKEKIMEASKNMDAAEGTSPTARDKTRADGQSTAEGSDKGKKRPNRWSRLGDIVFSRKK